jgi:hypothetical protein
VIRAWAKGVWRVACRRRSRKQRIRCCAEAELPFQANVQFAAGKSQKAYESGWPRQRVTPCDLPAVERKQWEELDGRSSAELAAHAHTHAAAPFERDLRALDRNRLLAASAASAKASDSDSARGQSRSVAAIPAR